MTPQVFEYDHCTVTIDQDGETFVCNKHPEAATPEQPSLLDRYTERRIGAVDWRKADRRLSWLLSGFLLYACWQLLWWVATAVCSGAFARAVAR